MAVSLTTATTDAALKSFLLDAKRMSEEDITKIREIMLLKTGRELHALAKSVAVRLTGSTRKADIVDRLIAMAKIGAVRDTSTDDSTGVDFTGINYITDEVKSALTQLPPFESITNGWKKSTKGILKDFTFMNLLIYLVYGRDKSFDMQSLKAFKSLKAYKFFYDGFVKNVWVHECSPTGGSVVLRVLYFRAYVHHSFTCESPLLVFVSINGDNGDVYAAKCNCVSGLGQACNHVAALLFFIEHYVSTGQESLPTEVSKTSKPMAWNQPPKKEVSPARAKDINFVKPSHSDIKENNEMRKYKRHKFDPRQMLHRTLDRDSLTILLGDIKKSVPTSGLMQFWENSPTHHSEQPESNLWIHVIFCHEKYIDFMKEFIVPSISQCCDYLKSLTLSQDEVNQIEAATREQARSNLWHALHNGRITSSRFGEILHRRQSTDSRRIVKDIMGYKKEIPKFFPPQIRWGRDNEPRALTCYLENQLAIGEEMLFEPAGLSLLPEKAYLGASSDGKLIRKSSDTCIGCLEIKCPYSIDGFLTISLTPDEIADKYGNKFMLQRGENGLLSLRRNHSYYAQVQGEMAILNVDWCDFVVYSKDTVIVDHIVRDFDYWTKLQEILDEFYCKHIIPEILSGKIFKEEYTI